MKVRLKSQTRAVKSRTEKSGAPHVEGHRMGCAANQWPGSSGLICSTRGPCALDLILVPCFSILQPLAFPNNKHHHGRCRQEDGELLNHFLSVHVLTINRSRARSARSSLLLTRLLLCFRLPRTVSLIIRQVESKATTKLKKTKVIENMDTRNRQQNVC